MSILKWWHETDDPELKEMAWERSMQVLGQVAYIKSNKERTYKDANGVLRKKPVPLSEQHMGMTILQETSRRAIEAIREFQKSLATTTRSLELRSTLISVPAETLALLTVRHLMDKTHRAFESKDGWDFLWCCKDLGGGIETEIRFRAWVEQSKEQAKEYAKLKGLEKVPKSRAELIMAETGLSPKVAARIRKSLKQLEAEKWEQEFKIAVGAEVIAVVVEALSDVFEIHVVQLPDRKNKMIRMTDEFRRQLKAREERVLSYQTIKKPMLVPPRRWAIHNPEIPNT